MLDGEELGLLEDDGGTGDETLSDEPEGGDESDLEGGDDEGGAGDEGEGGEGGEDELSEGDRGGRRTDAKTLPLQVRKALKAAAAANPDFAKQFPRLEKDISSALFKVGQVNSLGGVQKFQALADLVEAHGGEEGIASAMEELEAGRQLEDGFRRGDPAVVDGWAKDYPAGFKSLIRPALAKLESMDRDGYSQQMADPVWRFLDDHGVVQTFNALETALAAAGDAGKPALAELGKIKSWLGNLRGLATRANSPDPLKNDRDALSTREQELEAERTKMFYGSVRQDVNGQVTAQMNRIIRSALGGAKLKMETANRLRKEINSELARVVNSNKDYQTRYNAIMKSGDKDRAVRFIVQNAAAKLPGVVKQLIREFNLKPGGGKLGVRHGVRKPGAGGGSDRGGGGNNTVMGIPKTLDVNFQRTDKARFLAMKAAGRGEAWLLNGKLAKWG